MFWNSGHTKKQSVVGRGMMPHSKNSPFGLSDSSSKKWLNPLSTFSSTHHQEVDPQQLTIHSDRGGPMIAKKLALLVSDLGVTKSHSRPHVPDDNPYSEAHFKTMKYRPDYPDRFGCLEDSRSWARNFFSWYNFEHHHTGLGLMVPAMVHYGHTNQVQQARQWVLKKAFENHPERFVRGVPSPPIVPDAVWINKPNTQDVYQKIIR